MAQAESGKELLHSLTQSRLPANREPTEPSTRADERAPVDSSSGIEETGSRRPAFSREDLREERQPEKREASTDGKKPVRKIKWNNEELTIDDLVERGLIDSIIQSAQQLPALSRKHNELLEKVAGVNLEKSAAPAAPTQREQPPAPVLTPNDIVKVYAGMAKDNADKGWVEPDLIEAYPLLMANLMWRADQIDTLTTKFNDLIVCVSRMFNYLKAQEDAVQSQKEQVAVRSTIDQAVDAVAKKEGKLYKALSNETVRKDFIAWVIGDVNPDLAKVNAEFMDDMWMAFNAEALREFAKAEEEEEDPPPRRRRASSDGNSSRDGQPPAAPVKKSMLEKLTESKLGAAE